MEPKLERRMLSYNLLVGIYVLALVAVSCWRNCHSDPLQQPRAALGSELHCRSH